MTYTDVLTHSVWCYYCPHLWYLYYLLKSDRVKWNEKFKFINCNDAFRFPSFPLDVWRQLTRSLFVTLVWSSSVCSPNKRSHWVFFGHDWHKATYFTQVISFQPGWNEWRRKQTDDLGENSSTVVRSAYSFIWSWSYLCKPTDRRLQYICHVHPSSRVGSRRCHWRLVQKQGRPGASATFIYIFSINQRLVKTHW